MSAIGVANRAGLLGQAIGGIRRGLDWANLPGGSAIHAWDFLVDQARWNNTHVGQLQNTPNWTSSPATHSGGLSTYASKLDGSLQAFASGAFRRTDRGALIEGAGTNLQIKSQTFDNASWTKTRASVSADAAVAPDGTTTADKLIEDNTSSASHFINETGPTLTTTTAYTVSVYAKAAERSQIGLNLNASVGLSTPAVFDLSTGAVVTGGSFTASMQALGNGWYRCIATGTTTGSANSGIIIRTCLAGATSYNGDGTSGIYLWGAQLEAAAYASSYVPTTTGSATRAADSLTVTGVTGLDYPLSLYAEFERAADTGATERAFLVDDATVNNFASVLNDSLDRAALESISGGAAQGSVTLTGALAVNTTYKVASRFSTNSVQICRNGTLGTQDSTATNPAAPTRVVFGVGGTGAAPLYGYLRRLAIFSRALTDGELQALTAA